VRLEQADKSSIKNGRTRRNIEKGKKRVQARLQQQEPEALCHQQPLQWTSFPRLSTAELVKREAILIFCQLKGKAGYRLNPLRC
jgi:hypothetical protein